jgi:hypothetical protein
MCTYQIVFFLLGSMAIGETPFIGQRIANNTSLRDGNLLNLKKIKHGCIIPSDHLKNKSSLLWNLCYSMGCHR